MDIDDEILGGSLYHWGIKDSLEIIIELRENIYTWHNEKIAWLKEPPCLGPYGGGVWAEQAYMYNFAEMACGQALVGALAPLYETLIVRAFEKFREVSHGIPPLKSHSRWKATKKSIVWNPRYFVSPKSHKDGIDFLKGYLQLLDAIGHPQTIPVSIKEILDSLFSYRNKSFHQGFEWSQASGRAFAKKVEKEQWEGWFCSFENHRKRYMVSITKQFAKDASDAVKPLAEVLWTIEKELQTKNSGD